MATLNNEYFNKKMNDLKVKIRSGSSVVNVRPIFSYDSKFLIIASGPNVKVYNVQSGECLHTLCYHKTNVISLEENKNNCLQFYSCSEDGVIVRWELVEGTLLKVYDLDVPVSSFYAPIEGPVCFVTKKVECSEEWKLYSVQGNSFSNFLMHSVLPDHNKISFGFEAKFVAAVNGNSLNILQLEKRKFVKHLTGNSNLTCVACHPKDYSLATGDDTGRIFVWSNIFNSKNPIKSIYHWHTLPVHDLAFSSEGSYLYSGGGEAVLVKWNLFSEEKFFLPRLGAPILWIRDSPDSSRVAVALTDNSLQFVDPHRNVVGLIQGLTQGYFQGSQQRNILSTGLLYDPQLKSVVLNGKPGHLQFYSVFEDKHLFNLDISGKNFISKERDRLSYNIDVSKAAIDEKGHWLATVEFWQNEETSPMIWLKFWEYNAVRQIFTMNTNIYLPHNKEINCILFRPYDTTDAVPLAVTTSEDCHIKTWSLNDDSNSDGQQSWNCLSIDYYREHLPAGDASYSEDGSVLAVAVDNTATLWTDNNMQLEAALFLENNSDPIKQLRFGKQECNNLLVCHDGCKIYVWNVLSLSTTFIIHVNVQTIVTDIASDLMAVFSKDEDKDHQNLYMFRPNSPHPLLVKENVSNKSVLSALFIPRNVKNISEETHSFEKSQLYFFNEDQCLLTLTDECDDELDSNFNKIKINRNLPLTPFGQLQAEQKSSDVKKIEQQHIAVGYIDSEKDSLEYPNPTYMDHLALCTKILQSLLQPKPPQDSTPSENNSTDKHQGKSNTVDYQEKVIESNSMDIEIDQKIEIVEQKIEIVTPLVTDFSFLNKSVSLPMS